MNSMRNWMLGAAVVAAGLGMGATVAQAAEFGFHERGASAYIPPCPGPGYVWVAGYEASGYWVPGRWDFVGRGDRGHFARFDGDRDRGQEFGRRADRDRGGDRGRR